MAESIYIKELNKGIRETVKGLREVTIKLTPLEEALPEVTQGIGKLEHGAEAAYPPVRLRSVCRVFSFRAFCASTWSE